MYKSIILGLTLFTASLSQAQIGEKILAATQKIESTKELTEFVSKYIAVINGKKLDEYISLMHPASKECYKKSKHPEYYQTEIQRWFGATLQTLKEIRTYKTSYDFEFYKLMNYPKNPTHVLIFEGAGAKKSSWSIQSTEVIRENNQYYLLYRCM